MKKLLVLILAVILTSFALHAEQIVDIKSIIKGLSKYDTKKEYIIGTVVKVDGIAWFDRMRVGINQFKSDTKHDVWMSGPSQADAAAQVQMVENLISQGVDAITVVPFSPEALEPVLKKARKRGIVVIAHEAAGLKNADYVLEAFNNTAYGEELMRHLAKQMKESGEYVVTVGSLTSKTHNQWMDGAIAYQKKHYPNMRLVAGKLETYDDSNVDYNKLQEVLTTYPKLKGILGGPMPTSAGAGKLINEKGLQGKLFFSGTGLVSVAGEYLKHGDIKYIQFWDPAFAGYAMNALAVMFLQKRDKEIKSGLNLGISGYTNIIREDKQGYAPVLFGAGWVNVTKENMGKYNF